MKTVEALPLWQKVALALAVATAVGQLLGLFDGKKEEVEEDHSAADAVPVELAPLPTDADGRPVFGPIVQGPLKAWRESAQAAIQDMALLTGADFTSEIVKVCNLAGREDVTDADLVHLAGVPQVNIR